jgi:histidine triad (HIT) family protein
MSCLFCKIIAGEIPAQVKFQDEQVIAFADINPQAPVHLLIVPQLHVENAAELAAQSPAALSAVFAAADQLAKAEGLTGYRTIFNTGADAGQSVFHAHLHVLGGRNLAWPPG